MTTLEIARESRRVVLSIDRVWLVFIAIFAALAIFDPDQAATSVGDVIRSVLHIAPYLLLAITAAAYTSASSADQLIAGAFQGRTSAMVVLAAVFGAISPFCSCGVIPLIAALLAMGVPVAPVMAFWLASPLMDPSMFLVTAGEIGADFAIAKTLLAVGLGLWGGFGVMLLAKGTRLLENPLKEGVGDGGCGASSVRTPSAVVWRFWGDSERREKFAREALRSFLFLAKWLALAYLMESLFVAWIPAEKVAAFAGDGNVLSIMTAAILSLPLYLNGYAAIPLISTLMDAGMAPGAAMAFVIGGGVSCIPAAVGVFALVRLPVFLSYAALGLTGAMASGLVYQLWVTL